VKTGDRETKDVGASSERDGNVVRLPREWIGPLEDLVPIRPATETRDQPAEIAGDEVPPAADAFWSEDAGALHNAVQAPAGPSSGLAVPAPAESGGPGDGLRLRARFRPPVAAVRSRCRRPGAKRMAAAGVAGAVVVVAAIGTLWQSDTGRAPTSRTQHNLAQVGHSGARTDQPGRSAVATAAAATIAGRRSAGLNPPGRRVASGRHRAGSRKPVARHRGGTAHRGLHRASPAPSSATAEPVAASTVNSGAASNYPPATGAPPSTTTTPPTTTPVTQSASGGGASSAGSGSASSPAFGPSGALGPGSSPNS
jgi:hypothetical protein